MVLVEDAHLADPASAGVLTAVAQRTQRRPWLLLVTREDRPTGWIPTATRRIELGPMDMGSSPRAGRAGNARPAVAAGDRRGAGRPRRWTSSAAARARPRRRPRRGPDELPSNVEELAASQIDRLPPVERSLLRRAAVLGDEFDEDLLLRMVEDVCARAVGARAAGRTRRVSSWRRSTDCVSDTPASGGRLRGAAVPATSRAACAGRRSARGDNHVGRHPASGDPGPALLRGWPLRPRDGVRLGGGQRAMARYCAGRGSRCLPEGCRGCATGVRRSARANVRSTWRRWAMRSCLAGRSAEAAPRTWRRCAGCGANRCGRLIWRSTRPGLSNAAAITPTHCAGRASACVLWRRRTGS